MTTQRGHLRRTRALFVGTVVVSLLATGSVAVAAVASPAGAASPVKVTNLGALPSQAQPGRTLSKPAGDMSDPAPTGSDWRPGGVATRRGAGFDQARSTIIPGSLQPKTETYQNPDGSQTVVEHPSAVRFKNASGTWTNYDFTLRPSAKGGLEPTAASVPVRLNTDGRGAVAMDTLQGTVGLSAPDIVAQASAGPAAPATRVTGPQVVVDPAGAGPSLQVQPTVHGLEQQVTLPTTSGPSSYRMSLSVPAGLTPRNGGPGVEFVDATGTVAGFFGSGRAHDSAKRQAETDVHTSLVDVAGQVATVEVSIDPAWLADASRVAPVVIDPTLYYGNVAAGSGVDTYVETDSSTPQVGSTELRAGNLFGTVARSLLQFGGLPAPGPNMVAVESHLAIYNTVSAVCPAWPIGVYGIGQSWSPPNVVWSNQPTSDGKGQRSVTQPACSPGWMSLDTTALTNDWLRTGTPTSEPNFGLELTADEATSGSMSIFDSGETGTVNSPALYLTWDHEPNDSNPISPPDQATLSTLQPTLSATTATDPDGDPVKYAFRVATGADAGSGAIVANSGWLTGTTWTVPPNALMDGGVYYWQVLTYDGTVMNRPAWARQFKVDLRLGSDGPSPHDSFGPVNVNLATGNVSFATSSPTFPTVGGKVGLTYSYNSQQPIDVGLTGQYFNTNDLTGPNVMQRRDGPIWFDWGTGSPGPGVVTDNYSARWTGYLTVPTSGTWQLGGAANDGFRIFLDTGAGLANIRDNWAAPTWPNLQWSAGISLTAGRAYPIKIEYRETTGTAEMAFHAQGPGFASAAVPRDWLSIGASAMPQGWTVSADTDGNLSYVSARVSGSTAALTTSTGRVSSWTWTGSGWRPPKGDEGVLTGAPGQNLRFSAPDGMVYTFGSSGELQSVVSARDDTNAAAPIYNWDNGSPPRLLHIKDPLDQANHHMDLVYAGMPSTGTCPGSPPSGFLPSSDPSVLGQLCAVNYWDGTQTKLWYVTGGQLGRIEDPGGELTDFAYTNGRLSAIREPLAADEVAAGMRTANDPTITWAIVYNLGSGYAASVTAPLAQASDTASIQHTYNWDLVNNVTTVSLTGQTPAPASGYFRRVTYDDAAHQLTDADSFGHGTTQTWDAAADAPSTVIDAAGFETVTTYDAAHRPVTKTGPVPYTWFTGTTLNSPHTTTPGTGDTPQSQTFYDEIAAPAPPGSPGKSSLAVAYWNNTSLSGGTVAHSYGVGNSNGAIFATWAGSPAPDVPSTNWSARVTGEVRFPTADTYTLKAYASGAVRIYVDDVLKVDSWSSSSAPATFRVADANHLVTTTAPNEVHRIQVDYASSGPGGTLQLHWANNGNTVTGAIDGSYLKPRYGLVTAMKDADGREVDTSYATAYLGYPTATTTDPTGSNLISTASYDGYGRKLTSQLPKGPSTQVTSTYYGPSETRALPGGANCESGTVTQAGMLKLTTGATPATGSPITHEVIYDAAGRPAATKQSGDTSWSCVVYDSRGRVTSTLDAAGNVATNDYSTPGQVVSHFVDSSGTNRTTISNVDLLGHTTRYVDENLVSFRYVYDQHTGWLTDSYRQPLFQAEVQLTHQTFDDAGRSVNQTEYLTATPQTVSNAYDAQGRLSTTTLPTSPTPVVATNTYDANHGMLATVGYKEGATSLTLDITAHGLGGKVSVDWTPAYLRGFTYDGAGRLTAVTDSTNRNYYYDANTNRCSVTAACDGTTTGQYLYDNADRLVQSSAGTGYVYDAHGNLTDEPKAGGGTVHIDYDANDHAKLINDGVDKIEETLAPSGRVLRRKVTHLSNNTVTEDTTFGYSGGGDSPSYSLPTSGGTWTSYLAGAIFTGSSPAWELTTLHGDILGTVNSAGAYTAYPVATEYGVGTTPANRLGWLGAKERFTADATIGVMRMGVRLYDPSIGRFLEPDPVPGGSANDYDYVAGDPVNGSDIGGRCPDGYCNWQGNPGHSDFFAPNPPPLSPGIDTPPSYQQVSRHPSGHCHVCGHPPTVEPTISISGCSFVFFVCGTIGFQGSLLHPFTGFVVGPNTGGVSVNVGAAFKPACTRTGVGLGAGAANKIGVYTNTNAGSDPSEFGVTIGEGANIGYGYTKYWGC